MQAGCAFSPAPPNMSRYAFEGLDLGGVTRLAERLALLLREGDVVTLSGPLAAGKTTFARAVIRALGVEEDVPSPTFALAQTYESGRLSVVHADFYRLETPDEAGELGLEEAGRQGVVLLEWPERAPQILPPDRLDIVLEDGKDAETRHVKLNAHGSFAERLARLADMAAFLDASPWATSNAIFLQGDASTRAYARLRDGQGRIVVLMNAPAQSDGPAIKGGRPYSAWAHLAEDCRPFVAMAGALRALGLSAPEILACDLERGFLVLEDLGDAVYAPEIRQGGPIAEFHGAAVDVLLHLSNAPPPVDLKMPDGSTYTPSPFDADAAQVEIELLIDWLWPALKGENTPPDARDEFLGLWKPTLDEIATGRRTWLLRDFHSPNLIWLPDREGLRRVGIIDFQDAMLGPLAYDLVSLLQDARVDVPAALEHDLFRKYCLARRQRDSGFEQNAFEAEYAALGAQRNTKILGIFARLAKRDGKRSYIAHMPRVAEYLVRDLGHPGLIRIREWHARHLPLDETVSRIA